jgi:alginate O-acetyltransferase complex protein AlgI
MQYNSWVYLLPFLGLTLLAYYALPLPQRWKALLGASVVFYVISSRQLIAVLVLTTIPVFYGARSIRRMREKFDAEKAGLEKEERKRRRAALNARCAHLEALICALALGILFFTKYFNFVGSNLNLLLGALGAAGRIPTLHLLMPLGISFYTLSAVSYVADVTRGACPAEDSYWKLLTFLMFFPVITEGPICRYGQLGLQVRQGHAFDWRNFCFGLQLIVWGLFQKVVLADRIDHFVGVIFDNYARYSGLIVVVGTLLYTFQIYMDFAGCVDIARGSAQLFGIELPLNFTRPFFAVSVNDFWRRWHITLGAWLRDYIFYPISLSRSFQSLSKASRSRLSPYYAATLPALIALLAVWLGNGVWHGAGWKYIVYGLYYYAITAVGMLLEPAFAKALAVMRIDRKGLPWRVFQTLRTFVLVNIGMLLFRASSLRAGAAMLASILRRTNGSVGHVLATQGLPSGQLALVLTGAAAVLAVGILQERGVHIRERLAALPLPVRWSVYLFGVLFVIITGAYGPGFGIVDFIYAQF